jgi:hypothetical protein
VIDVVEKIGRGLFFWYEDDISFAVHHALLIDLTKKVTLCSHVSWELKMEDGYTQSCMGWMYGMDGMDESATKKENDGSFVANRMALVRCGIAWWALFLEKKGPCPRPRTYQYIGV